MVHRANSTDKRSMWLDVVCHLLERATEALGGDVLPADTSAVEL